MKICPNCQSEVPDGKKFCSQCGTDLTDSVSKDEEYMADSLADSTELTGCEKNTSSEEVLEMKTISRIQEKKRPCRKSN